MSFMDAMKKVDKTNVEAGVPKVNPLLQKLNASKQQNGDVKKPNPLLKPKAKTEETVDKSIQQKAVEEAKAVLKAKEKEEAKVEEVKVVEETVTQEVAPKVAATEDKEEVEEITIAVPVVEEKAETKVEEAAEEVKEEPKKKRRTSKKAKEPKVSETKDTVEETVEMFTTRISYEDAVNAIRGPFSNNEEFEMLKEEIAEELNAIVISEDINSITAKTVNAQLSALYQKVWFEHQAAKTFFENLTQKDNGLIDVVKYSSIGEGSNDAQRKKAGIEACMRYVAPGATEPVNLFEVLAFAREQYYFFESVMKHLSYKKDVMISMNAALKIEDKVLGSGTQIN